MPRLRRSARAASWKVCEAGREQRGFAHLDVGASADVTEHEQPLVRRVLPGTRVEAIHVLGRPHAFELEIAVQVEIDAPGGFRM